MEVCAPKPGNVHRGADFADVTFEDFVVSAEVFGNVLDDSTELGVGATILKAIEVTRSTVGTNTNLGMVLLLVPLAKTLFLNGALNQLNVSKTLESLDENDAKAVYAAINHAKPGGMGAVSEMDLAAKPPSDLIAAMRASASQDMIALQFSNGFSEVFDEVVPLLEAAVQRTSDLRSATVEVHLKLISRYGDSLIARKCGASVSENASRMATIAVERLTENKEQEYLSAVADLDFWMRSDGNRRNPGTTADLITAGLFVGFANGIFSPTFKSE